MTLEQFGFVKHSASTSSAAVSWQRATEASSTEHATALPLKKRRFNSEWAEGREWLQHDTENGVMFCEWCRCFDRNEHRNQFVKGCGSMKLESVKKHELSRQHKDAEAAHRAHVQPDHAPMELAIQKMEKEEVEQMKSLFNTAFYLVAAERPFSDFPALLQLQRLNGLPLGKTYSNPKQARMFVHYIAEEMSGCRLPCSRFTSKL